MVVLINFREPATERPWQELGADISEEVHEGLRGAAHCSVFGRSEKAEVLNLGLIKREWHSGEDLSDGVETSSDVLIVTVISHEVADDLFNNWSECFGWHKVMAGLNDDGKDLRNLVLGMGC